MEKIAQRALVIVLCALLLGLVLTFPALAPLFSVAKLSSDMLAAVVGLAFGSMLIIQIMKLLQK